MKLVRIESRENLPLEKENGLNRGENLAPKKYRKLKLENDR